VSINSWPGEYVLVYDNFHTSFTQSLRKQTPIYTAYEAEQAHKPIW